MRLLAVVLGGLAALTIFVYSMYRAFMTPERRLSSQFRNMKELILDSVDEEDRTQAEQLLEDCREHLDGLIQAQERIETLSEMSETASELTGAQVPDDLDQLERQIQEDISDFLSEMAQISSQLQSDDRRSLKRLQDFTDEIGERQHILEELDETA